MEVIRAFKTDKINTNDTTFETTEGTEVHTWRTEVSIRIPFTRTSQSLQRVTTLNEPPRRVPLPLL